MWLDAGYVEEQYFAVELDTLEHVQRQGDDRGDPRTAIPKPAPACAPLALVLEQPHWSEEDRRHPRSENLEDVLQEHFRVQPLARSAVEGRVLCGADHYVV